MFTACTILLLFAVALNGYVQSQMLFAVAGHKIKPQSPPRDIESQLICEKTTEIVHIEVGSDKDVTAVEYVLPDTRTNITECRVNRKIKGYENYRCIPGQSSREIYFRPMASPGDSDCYLRATLQKDPIMDVCDAVYIDTDRRKARNEPENNYIYASRRENFIPYDKKFNGLFKGWPVVF